MRAVAEGAGVDVALVPYYFGNKDGLFAAALELPVDPHQKIDEIFAQGLDGSASGSSAPWRPCWTTR